MTKQKQNSKKTKSNKEYAIYVIKCDYIVVVGKNFIAIENTLGKITNKTNIVKAFELSLTIISQK